MEQRVRAECQRRRLQRAHLIVIMGNALLTIQVVSNLSSILMDEPVNGTAALYMHVAFVVLISLLPRALTHQTIDVIYSLVMLGLIITLVVTDPDQFWITESLPEALVMALFWSLFNMNLWLNAVWMVATATALIIKSPLSGPSPIQTGRSFILALCVLSWLDHCLESGVRLEIREMDSNSHLKAVRTLLNSLCDIVIEMDSGLRLTQHSPKLADMLLQGPLRSLEGTTLQDFIPAEADRENLTRQLNAADEKATHATVFHTKLCDGVGKSVSLELFSVAFKGVDARRRHVLGMREFPDVLPSARLEQLGAEAETPETGCQAPKIEEVPEQAWTEPPQTVEQGDGESRTSSCSSVSGDQHPGLEECQVAMLRTDHDVRLTHTLMKTTEMAKRITIINVLLGWNPPSSEHDCCSWHAAVAEAQRILATMKSDACDPDCGHGVSWQCRRCGILAQEFRDERREDRCKLCMSIDSEDLDPDAASSSGSGPLSL
eukprot:CAMPEP_0113821968 /NCGR_PEP_ID=MMETSP0328-20130328/2005_1 /TAXON_ID=39455 /ORGANISM="Alexandrium minutum" /LENGTH=489 /DNA_ID=CAMNT_0000789903 /DNA_START=78 /DNA_END=1547 /DNA_ORIENTATION=+ /assembly_acc=CAM_ASM_000350